ncbi:Uncharacterised protein [Yersinia similis]|nr:Uncharacterised protein [Yersinia similis]CNF44858.1 Uncharacterised protein [Yersinia similis]
MSNNLYFYMITVKHFKLSPIFPLNYKVIFIILNLLFLIKITSKYKIICFLMRDCGDVM